MDAQAQAAVDWLQRISDTEKERDELKQRLSDLATAVHDWAEAHAYAGPLAKVIDPAKVPDADRELLDAYRRSQD